MFNGHVVIFCDGGCSGNGGANPVAYGSYILRAYKGDDLVSQKVSGRMEYPEHGTNNAAELETLIRALEALKPGDYSVKVYTDSQLVVGWVTLGYKCKHDHLRPLIARAKALMALLPGADIEHVSRDVIVHELGH
jgi:ribonuclease HI